MKRSTLISALVLAVAVSIGGAYLAGYRQAMEQDARTVEIYQALAKSYRVRAERLENEIWGCGQAVPEVGKWWTAPGIERRVFGTSPVPLPPPKLGRS